MQRRVKAGDIRMNQAGVHLDFAQEPAGHSGVCYQAGEHNLHRIDSIGDQVPHPEHSSHAASTQYAKDLIIPDSVPDLQVHMYYYDHHSKRVVAGCVETRPVSLPEVVKIRSSRTAGGAQRWRCKFAWELR